MAPRLVNLAVFVVSVPFVALQASCSITIGGGIPGMIDNIISNLPYAIQTIQRPLTVWDARSAYLFKTSKVFYPNGVPADPNFIPDLDGSAVREVERVVARAQTDTLAAMKTHSSLIKRHFPSYDAGRGLTQISITKEGRGIAATDATGRFEVDVKVIQAIYRSTLLDNLLERERETASSIEAEKKAFGDLAKLTKNLDEMSWFQPLSDLKRLSSGNNESAEGLFGGGLIFGMFNVLGGRLEDIGVILTSRRLERSFLGALSFLLAHEAAHVALGHFLITQVSCKVAQQLEQEADEFAVLVSNLARFDALPTPNVDDLSFDSIGANGWKVLELIEESGGSHRMYFKYAHRLAGFDRFMNSVPNCRYPTAEARELNLNPMNDAVAGMARSVILSNAFQNSSRYLDIKRQAPKSFESHYRDLLRDSQKEKKSDLKSFLQESRPLLRDVHNTYHLRSTDSPIDPVFSSGP